jgi:hypothetical protein
MMAAKGLDNEPAKVHRISDAFSVVFDWDEDTVTVLGNLKGSLLEPRVLLSSDEFEAILVLYLDGFCCVPGCGEDIPQGQILCRTCIGDAIAAAGIPAPVY